MTGSCIQTGILATSPKHAFVFWRLPMSALSSRKHVTPQVMGTWVWIFLSLVLFESAHAQVASNSVFIRNTSYPSIQAAANAAKQGDTVVIRSGVYRETIKVTQSNIVFRGETGAIISGLEPVTGAWTAHSGTIKKVSNPQVTQLFRDGEMMFEARWPKINNFDGLFDRSTYRLMPSSSANTITDSGIPANMVGAKIWINGWYISFTGTVTGQSGSTITHSRNISEPGMRKYYYLTGKLSLLTAPNEWFWENGTLYIGGTTDNIEYKARTIGFDVRGVSNTTIIGLEFVGCDPVVGDLSSSNTLIDGIKAKYTNHVFDINPPPNTADFFGAMAVNYCNALNTGIKLIGPNSEIRNSEIDRVASQAIWLGQGCRAVNNRVTNVGYEGNWGCAFMMWERTNGQKVLRNTVKVTGRSAVDYGYRIDDDKRNIEIAYNDFSEYGCLNIDVGAIYSGHFKVMDNTEVHHNWIHDIRAEYGDGVNTAIYYDMGSGPAFCHHNVMWNNTNDVFVNSNFEHRSGVVGVWYNNTFVTKLPPSVYAQSYKSVTTRDIHRNNIYRSYVTLNLDQWTPDMQNCITLATDPQFVGSGNGGLAFQLKSTSPAINTGMVIPGITDGAVGNPDIGAYEYGVSPWIPGYTPVSVGPPPNIPPAVTLTTPGNNAQFPAGSNITLTASATDSDGSIAKVEFYSGNTKLGEDTSSPYTITWSNVAAGTYPLTARATDNKGATRTSAVINITVLSSNTPPSVTITSPSNNASYSVGENLTIAATAADGDGTVSKVEFYNGTVKLGEDTTYPYSFTWNNLGEGTLALTAKAYDNQNAVTTSAVIQVTVTKPNAGPTVVLTGPTNNTSVQAGSNLTITATATDADGAVNKVEFFSGNNKLGEDTTSPYSFVWNNVPAGNYSLTAKATDNLDAVGISASIGVIVVGPNLPPTVAITSPAHNTSFQAGSNITITATANDPDGSISKVEFFSGTTKIGEDVTTPYSLVWQNVAFGTYTLTARATDNQNAIQNSTPISITVAPNSPPVVTITAPADDHVYIAGDDVTITAIASDNDGSVGRVEFYNGTNRIGEDLTSPYKFVWRNIPVGVYNVSAIATDNQYATGTSSPVRFTVVAATAPTVSAGADVVVTPPDESASLTATGQAVDGTSPTFLWVQVSGPNQAIISNPGQADIIVSGLIEGVYVFEVTATDRKNHSSKDRVKVVMSGEVEVIEPVGIIPRFFTPNGDGVNDTWEWPHSELLDNAQLMVFNRRGQKVYEALPYDNTWDGSLDGKPLEADAYYYVIRLLDQTDIKGAVRIIR